MGFPVTRLRRLRAKENFRRLVRETHLSVDDLIYPLFVIYGRNVKQEIPSMPGIYRWSLDRLPEEIEEVAALDIPAVLLFGIPEHKDEVGSGAYDEHGIVQEAIRVIKGTAPELLVVADTCLCEYTSHGHCGLVDEEGRLLNDPTLELLQKTALSQAQAGADLIAPSDMMDGRVAALRQVLDENGFSHVPIMSYAAKYASSFYGPFRDAADSAPQFGDRRAYQMDPPNWREARREVALDLEEGADIVMVKPALAYLDVLREVREMTDLPVAAYNVSGEFSLVKAAAQNGWIDERKIVLEILTGIKRAGADIIITYFAKDLVRWLA
ncbi:MAG TPA: porphobilinogen synthase [Armatimonadetes bacterium]|nr:porphobilinogen synthase [Armatimonadota bacterium]